MDRLSAALLLLLAAGMAAAAGGQDRREADHAESCSSQPHRHFAVTAEGEVIDAAGRTVPGAMVWVGYFTLSGKVRRPLAQGRTNAHGRFSIPCAVTVFSSGTRYRFEELEALALTRGEGIGVQPFPMGRAQGLRLRLEPVAAVTGRVLTCEGRPVRGAQVQVSSVTGIAPRPVVTWVLGEPAVVRADAEGRFQVPFVPLHGEASVRIRAAGRFEGSARLRRDQGAGVVLHQAGVLEGRLVQARNGRPLPAARVRAIDLGSAALLRRETRTTRQGRFRFSGLHGFYQLDTPELPLLPLEVHVGRCQVRRLADLCVPVGAVVAGQLVGVRTGTVGSVKARPLQMAAPPAPRVFTRSWCSQPSSPAPPAARWTRGAAPAAGMQVAADGSFLLRLPAGEWEVAVALRDPASTTVVSAHTRVRLREGERVRVPLTP